MTLYQHAKSTYVPLAERAILSVSGEQAGEWLQGLVTCNIDHVNAGQARLGALLTPQGKFLHDFFIWREAEASVWYLETERTRLAELETLLRRYRLRARIEIEERTDWHVVALLGKEACVKLSLPLEPGAMLQHEALYAIVDPRFFELGVRLVGTAEALTALTMSLDLSEAGMDAYECLRLLHAIPEGSKDAEIDRTILQENGYDQFRAIDFHKGCYIGQEVTARTKHRGTLRKFLHHVRADTKLPPAGTEITAGDVRLGVMRSTHGDFGLALIRHDALLRAQSAGLAPQAEGLDVRLSMPWWYDQGVQD